MNAAHLHLVLNHFPTIGTIVGLGLFILALASKSDDLKRASLGIFFLIALLAIPVYLSGDAAREQIEGLPGISESQIQSHQNAALLAFAFMELTGLFAWLGLWRFRGPARPAAWNMSSVLLLSLLTVALMARAATMGGEIRHPEIRPGNDTTATEVITGAEIEEDEDHEIQ